MPSFRPLLAGYELEFVGNDWVGNCQPPFVSTARELTDLTITEKVKRGCDYELHVSIGELNSMPTTAGFFNQLGTSYFSGSVKVTKEQIGNAPTVNVSIQLKTTEEGIAAGFKGGEYADINVEVLPPI